MTRAPPPAFGAGRSLDLRRPPIAEITALARQEAARGREIIDLGQAVLGLGPPPAALARVHDYLAETPVHRYAPDPGLPEAREAVASLWRSAKGVPGARAEQVMLTCGANQAFVNALLTLSRPGDEVITFGPGYFDHDFAIRLAGCTPVEVPLRVDGPADRPAGFGYDVEAVRAALGPRTRCVVLVSPGNPTGAVIADEERRALVRLCRQHGLWLVSDETYDLLTFPPARHRSPIADDEVDPERVVALGSFSKIFGLAAWRVGYLFGPPAFVEEAVKAQDALVVCAPVPSQQAALGALQQSEQYTRRAREALIQRRDRLLERLSEHPHLAPTRPDGATFVLARLVGPDPRSTGSTPSTATASTASAAMRSTSSTATALTSSAAMGTTPSTASASTPSTATASKGERAGDGAAPGVAGTQFPARSGDRVPAMGDEQAAAACSEQSAAADDVAFCKALVKRAGVVAVPGSAFGPRGAGWVRLSYGNQPPEQIDRACDRMLAVRGSRVFASPSSRRR